MSEHPVAERLDQALEIEALGDDVFRSVSLVDTHGYALYGGQTLALALRAAASTVEADRRPHSLHGYFLRAGRGGTPITLHVDRQRDGRTFCARHVVARQGGETIFSMIVSFSRPADGYVFDGTPRKKDNDRSTAEKYHTLLLDQREFTPRRTVDGRMFYPDHVDAMSLDPLPDDWITHTCAVAYMSDLGTGFGQIAGPDIGGTGPTVSHSVWFHAPSRADDWLTIETRPLVAGGGRGLYSGTVRDADGNLVAVIAQEELIRPPAPEPPA